MDIEPLKSYLDFKGDIKEKLIPFLENSIITKIKETEYIEQDFYINDRLFFIKRNTLELEYIGKIYCIDVNLLGIKLSQYRNVTLDPKKYYIFKKTKKKTKREIMEELLEKL
tara:strand:+ start:73 stop:408 length:336 start_codon:yes stop_codon:yes gene_type:complete